MPATLQRAYGSRALKTGDAERRLRFRRHRDEMRASPVWAKCLAALQSMCLFAGHVRPEASQPAWMMQPIVMPGDPAASAAAKAEDIAGNFKAAFVMKHPRACMSSNLQPSVRAAVAWQCDLRKQGDDVKMARDARFSTFCQCSRDLEGWSRQLGRCSPEWVAQAVPRAPHFALFDCCSEACGLPDDALVEDMVCGAPAVGECPDSGRFRAEWSPAAVDIDDLDHASWHARLERELTEAGLDPARAAEHDALWERTTKEVLEGFATRIGSLSDAEDFFGGPQAFRAMVRFAVEQKGKIRPCDNARSSLHNLATTLRERLALESADFPARVAALYAELMGDSVTFAFHLGTEDVASAYRRMACSQPWFTVFAQWDPGTRSVAYFRLQGFNFGLRSAVVAFNRLSACMQDIFARVLGVCCANYFDDFCCAEPSFSKGGQQLMRDAAERLGVEFAGDFLGQEGSKSDGPGPVNTFLGVQHDFSRFARERVSTASVDEAKLLELADDISTSLRGAGSFAPVGGPLKLAGRLQFTLTWGMGRLGRSALNPLYAAAGEGRTPGFSPELRQALAFLRDILVDTEKRVRRLRPRTFAYKRSRMPAVLVWSDARWEASASKPAGLGFVVFFPASAAEARKASAATAARTPPWMMGASTPVGEWRYAAYAPAAEEYAHWRERSQYVGQLELLAAVAVYYSLAAELRGREVIHFIDNSGAMACLIKNYSSDRDSSRIVHTFWALAGALEIDVWFEYVRSAANIADWPSRDKLDFVPDLGARVVDPWVCPPTEAWGSVEAVLRVAESVPERPAKRARS